ncbi:hypothetical protein CYMTET_48932 [Cymbomonas tetramitiformis]|uniref:Uncharacterized protein n=1 Tax=Cymbomonas tetramitiformis TaxID=36881 RepID=A0AAE0EWA4_9CHLO|nr:hypothetical protein CYMTET_48932 [Cymbomonas tetramitiformis]
MFLKERFFSRKPQEVQEGLEDPTVREFQRADVDTDHVDTVPIMDPTSQRIKPRTVGKSGAERAPSEAAMSKEELLQLASVGNVSACFQLGCRYLQGIVEEASPSQASRWFLRAVEEHHSDAQTNLGSCFLEGLGVYRNVPRALKLYRASAIQGNPHGQFNLGVCFRDGMGVKRDLDTATHWFYRAACQNHAPAQNSVGVMYQRGHGVIGVQDEAAAAGWFRKAAKQNNVFGQYNLGMCYILGKGLDANVAEGHKWLMAAAAQGHVDAIAFLARDESIIHTSSAQERVSTPSRLLLSLCAVPSVVSGLFLRTL